VIGWLRALGGVVLALGLASAVLAGWFLMRDVAFAEAAAAYRRHPGHPLFQADYWVAAIRHYGLVALVAGGLLVGLIGGSALLALGQVLRRLPPR
jgi:hypothetical protein